MTELAKEIDNLISTITKWTGTLVRDGRGVIILDRDIRLLAYALSTPPAPQAELFNGKCPRCGGDATAWEVNAFGGCYKCCPDEEPPAPPAEPPAASTVKLQPRRIAVDDELDENAKLRAEVERLKAVIANDCENEAMCRDIAATVLERSAVDGDSYAVPSLADIMQMLVQREQRLRAKLNSIASYGESTTTSVAALENRP